MAITSPRHQFILAASIFLSSSAWATLLTICGVMMTINSSRSLDTESKRNKRPSTGISPIQGTLRWRSVLFLVINPPKIMVCPSADHGVDLGDVDWRLADKGAVYGGNRRARDFRSEGEF